ncbi:hypothetical protein B0T10DRAFT_577585 [Thelonectria olida]|uniref:Nephrocystin 3-like N-terminal domain-containing protein n=1 Tax=Thelonectria olida TaxID=1576542 RepID=A0A9P9ASA7_9HYPO|nr:hypothetical protein B0T10DRAFT_577585 [Thelonectria olida]
MDPLSISASIAGLVSLADLVFRAATKYVRGVRGSRKEVEDLSREVKNLSVVLHHLSLVAFDLEAQPTDGELASSSSSGSPNLKPHHLHECQQLLRRLAKALGDTTSNLSSTFGLERLGGRLKWPFSSTETKEILQAVQRHKQTIDLAVAADSLSKLKLCLSRQAVTNDCLNDIQATVNKILDLGTKTYFEKRKKNILDAFMKANPFREFEANRTLRHALTGLWLTEGPDFEEWYDTPGSRVWFSGIPGAGKSVLAASIIEECGRRNGADPNLAVAYFFCTYRDERTHMFSSILSTLCAQLALQDEKAFKFLEEYYDELKSGYQVVFEPSTKRLTEVLHQMCALYGRVYFVIDGLDECGDHVEATVRSLVDLTLSQSNEIISLALVSRDEIPIRHQVESLFRNVEIEAHTEDIQHYVASELRQRISSGRLRLRDLALEDQILTKLVNEAQGMFRWVTCQLDHICELPTDRSRREALDKLPPTLPATYERILMRIERYDGAVKQLVQRTLLLIHSSLRRPLTFPQICEAISIDTDSDTLFDDGIVQEQEVLRWCGSLIRTSKNGSTIEFAHFTVQEYLQGSCFEHCLLSKYGCSSEKAYNLLGPLCLRFLTLKNHERMPEATESEAHTIIQRHGERPFYKHAAIQWMYYTQHCTHSDSSSKNGSTQHIDHLFQIQKTPSFCSWAIELICHCLIKGGGFYFEDISYVMPHGDTVVEVISAVLRPDFTPLHVAAALGMPDLCRHLLEHGSNVGLRSKFGTPFHCAIGALTVFTDRDNLNFFPPLIGLREGASSPLARRQTVQLLLEAGCKPGLQLTTPFRNATVLSLAVSSYLYRDDFEIVVDLVKVGITVEEEDLDCFEKCYSYLLSLSIHRPPKNIFMDHFNGGWAFTSLLEALGEQPSTTTEPKSRLYHKTLELLNRMRLEVPHELSNLIPVDESSDEESSRFLNEIIRQNNVLALNRFLQGSRSKLARSTGINVDSPDWTSLHLAIHERSLDVLDALLGFGVDPNTPDRHGKTPVHLCLGFDHEDALKTLLQHGATTVIPDERHKTVWHYIAETNSTRILSLLVELDERDFALQMESEDGETPICAALNCGCREFVLRLLKYCNSEKFWKSNKSIFRAAAQLGSSEVIQTLLDAGVKVDGMDDDEGSPLHFLGPNSTTECIRILKDIFPIEQRRQEDLRTPLELMLSRTVRNEGALDREILMSLLPGTLLSTPSEASTLWSFVCSETVAVAMQHPWAHIWFRNVFSTLIGLGIVKLYEAECGKSAIVPFVSSIASNVPMIYEGLESGDTTPVRLQRWEGFSKTVQEIAKETKCWASAVNEGDIVRLLSQSILHDDQEMILLLLENGINVHSRIDLLSPFDFACFPEVPIRGRSFQILLSHATPDSISNGNESFHGCGPLHFVSGFNSTGNDSVSKLRRLLQSGVDCNLPVSAARGSPLTHNIYSNPTEAAEMFLDFGADPWVANRYGFDAALSAVLWGHVSVLARIAAIPRTEDDTPPRWDRTWTQSWGGKWFSGGNALHLAASYGEIKCLEFYLDQNILSDLEARDSDLATPLHYAARFGQSSIIKVLKARGGDIDATDRSGLTPLHLAASMQHLETVKILLNMGAKHPVCHAGCTPAAYAYTTGNENVIKALETSSEGYILPDISVTSPRVLGALVNGLRKAIQEDDVDACQRLRTFGCPINIRFNDSRGLTPLGLAIKEQKTPEVVQWLLDNGATVSTTFEDSGRNVLHLAVRYASFNPILSHLIERYLEEGGRFSGPSCTILHAAVEGKNIEGLQILLDTLRSKCESQDLMLHSHHLVGDDTLRLSMLDAIVNARHSAYPHPMPLHLAALKNDVDACKALISNGASLDGTDGCNSTALHCAASYGSQEVARYLLTCGADSGAVNVLGRTPLIAAYSAGKLELVRLLTTSRQPTRMRADYAGRNGLHFLGRYGGRTEAERAFDTQLFFRFLDEGLNLHQPDVFGRSAAHWLLASYSAVHMRSLLNRDAHLLRIQDVVAWPDALFEDGTQRLIAIAQNLRLLSRLLGKSEIYRLLGLTTPGNHNLMCRAAFWGQVEAIQGFLSFGVNVLEHQCHDHGVPLVAAFSTRQTEAIKCLVRHGARIPHHLLKTRNSDMGVTNPDFAILQWLFVGRLLERPRISCSTTDGLDKTGNWAGPRMAQVALRWEWRKVWNESILQYAQRRQGILSSLRGTIVEPVGCLKESNVLFARY